MLYCDSCNKKFDSRHGGSWLWIPPTEGESGETGERCAKCTQELGPLSTEGRYDDRLCCGLHGTQLELHDFIYPYANYSLKQE